MPSGAESRTFDLANQAFKCDVRPIACYMVNLIQVRLVFYFLSLTHISLKMISHSVYYIVLTKKSKRSMKSSFMVVGFYAALLHWIALDCRLYNWKLFPPDSIFSNNTLHLYLSRIYWYLVYFSTEGKKRFLWPPVCGICGVWSSFRNKSKVSFTYSSRQCRENHIQTFCRVAEKMRPQIAFILDLTDFFLFYQLSHCLMTHWHNKSIFHS